MSDADLLADVLPLLRELEDRERLMMGVTLPETTEVRERVERRIHAAMEGEAP